MYVTHRYNVTGTKGPPVPLTPVWCALSAAHKVNKGSKKVVTGRNYLEPSPSNTGKHDKGAFKKTADTITDSGSIL